MQWRIVFSAIKIFVIFITATVLLAGTIQGAISYADYCTDHHESYYNYYSSFTDHKRTRCNFAHNSDSADVDFVAVVVFSGAAAFFYVSK